MHSSPACSDGILDHMGDDVMDARQAYIGGIADTAAMVAREIASARGRESDLLRRGRHLTRKKGEVRRSIELKRAIAGELRRIPLLGGLLSRIKLAEVPSAILEAELLTSEIAQLRHDLQELRKIIRELEGIADGLKAARTTARDALLPRQSEKRVEAAGRRASFLRRKIRPSREEITECASEIIEAAADWSRAARAFSSARPQKAQENPPAVTRKSRIYLPIPVSMRQVAKRMGAKYDPDAPPGSRMYVPVEADLDPFERMLPLSFRKKPPKLLFPPIRPRAAGQAIWGVFDRQTWDHIRTSAYDRTGRRCMLCGKWSGSMRQRLFPEQGKAGPVECHEVWDWKTVDLSEGIGVQKLKALLVLCFECHAVFHERFMVAAGRKVGLADEVASFIEARRLALTRLEPEELQRSLERSRREWETQNGIDNWVLDLSHLASQDFMAHAQPVVPERNPAGIRPENIAGIAFVTDAGREFPARPAAEIVGEILSDTSQNNRILTM